MMKKHLTISLLGLALPLAASAASYSDPVGMATLTAPAGTVAVSQSFVNPIEWQGEATSTGTTTITVTGENFGDYNSGFFVEFLSNGFEGSMATIVSASGDTLTIDRDISALSGTEVFAIRAVQDLSDLLPMGTLQAFSDTVLYFAEDGTALSLLQDGTGGWISTSFVAVDTPVVKPGQAVVVTTATGFSLTQIGSVKVGPTVVELTANIPQLFGTLNPVDDLTLAEANLGSVLSPFSDTVSVIATDGTAALTGALYSGTGFVGTDFVTPLDTLVIPSLGAVYLQPSSDASLVLPTAYTETN